MTYAAQAQGRFDPRWLGWLAMAGQRHHHGRHRHGGRGFPFGGPWGFGAGYYGYGYGGGTTSATSTTIHVGTLGVDFYDRAAKQLVWRGIASKTIDTGAKPEKRQKNLAKAAKKLLKNYPPPQKK